MCCVSFGLVGLGWVAPYPSQLRTEPRAVPRTQASPKACTTHDPLTGENILSPNKPLSNLRTDWDLHNSLPVPRRAEVASENNGRWVATVGGN